MQIQNTPNPVLSGPAIPNLQHLCNPSDSRPFARAPFGFTYNNVPHLVASDGMMLVAIEGVQGPAIELTAHVTNAITTLFGMPAAGAMETVSVPLIALKEWAGDPWWDTTAEQDSLEDEGAMPLFPGTISGVHFNRVLLARALDGFSDKTVQVHTNPTFPLVMVSGRGWDVALMGHRYAFLESVEFAPPMAA